MSTIKLMLMPASFKPTLGIIGLTLVIFALTKNPLTGPFSLQMTMASLLVLLFYGYFVKKQGQVLQIKNFVFFIAAFVLFLVASTGWFFSPFFFTLYLLAVFLAFIFPPAVSAGFASVLVGLFSLNIGEVDLAYDFLVILSLLSVIPLVFYLRKEYLKLKEAEKEILVLEKEKKEYQSKVEEVLANTVNKLAADLRQPINDVKQLTYRLVQLKDQKQIERNRLRIIASSEEALRTLREFEEKATGKKLLRTPGGEILPGEIT